MMGQWDTMGQWVKMGQWVMMGQWVTMGHGSRWVNGSWVTYTMGQMGHGSRKVTHGPLCTIVTLVSFVYHLFIVLIISKQSFLPETLGK